MHKRILVRLQVGNAKETESAKLQRTSKPKTMTSRGPEEEEPCKDKGLEERTKSGHFCCTLRSLCQLN